jgi:YbbR domain-containing protein
VNVAETDFAASMVTAQVPVPEQPLPVQPAKVEVPSGEAVRVTTMAASNVEVQVAPQEMPAGADDTVPLPEPALDTVSVSVNLAEADFGPSMVKVQVPVPEHAPAQPAKIAVPAGVAVSVTEAPESKDAEQFAPQAMPAGVDATVPPPVLVTESE